MVAGNQSIWLAVLGAIALICYGIIPTLQPANFGIYAAYGGVFIVLSLIWGWQVDRTPPDKFDLLGGAIALIGCRAQVILINLGLCGT
ncbi:MAG: YnfA family protein [Crinalium sp.]